MDATCSWVCDTGTPRIPFSLTSQPFGAPTHPESSHNGVHLLIIVNYQAHLAPPILVSILPRQSQSPITLLLQCGYINCRLHQLRASYLLVVCLRFRVLALVGNHREHLGKYVSSGGEAAGKKRVGAHARKEENNNNGEEPEGE